MKLCHSHKIINFLKCSRVLFSNLHTKTLNPEIPTSLYNRIHMVRDPRASIVPVLEQWVQEGQPIDRLQLRSLVRLMKDYRRFHHALEVSKWMTDRRYFVLSPRDVAIRLDLIFRVHGLEHAELYFNSISNNLKGYQVYGALLSSYVHEKCVEKSEAVMQKMREMGMIRSSFTFNMLMNLYSQTGEREKIDKLMQEMERKGIPQDMYTIRTRTIAYIEASDICGMERFLNRMEEDPRVNIDWSIYSIAASGYLKFGSTGKALTMLKKMEKNILPGKSQCASDHLLSLYASAGQKAELYRIWNLYKPSADRLGIPYACMITSLAKLDDIEGAEKIFQEWESQCTGYDFRVLNRLIAAYCKLGLLDKAQSAVNNAVKGRRPYASTWQILANGYMNCKQMSKAVEMLKKAMLDGRKEWRPSPSCFAACLDYLEEQGDVEGMEEIIGLYKNLSPLTKDIYHQLLRIYAAAGKSVSKVHYRMQMDGFAPDEETEKILESSTKELKGMEPDVCSVPSTNSLKSMFMRFSTKLGM